MIVYDDLEPSEKIKVYDKGITLNGNGAGEKRLPDAGRLPHRRHVGAAARHDARRSASRLRQFVDCIETAADADRPTARPACASSASSKPPRSRWPQRGRLVELEAARCTA